MVKWNKTTIFLTKDNPSLLPTEGKMNERTTHKKKWMVSKEQNEGIMRINFFPDQKEIEFKSDWNVKCKYV